MLSAVFVPMAFFGGSTGAIYRQFSITIVSAMALSVLVALVLTPALCATMLKPIQKGHHAKDTGFFGWFNNKFDAANLRYQSAVGGVIRRSIRFFLIYVVIIGIMAFLFIRMPTAFLPDEDQGILFTQVQLPVGATQEQTLKSIVKMENHFLQNEKSDVESVFSVAGFSFAGRGQNMGLAFVRLKDWSVRGDKDQKVTAIANRAMGAFAQYKEAMAFAFAPPAVLELGNATGFDLQLQDRGGVGHDKLIEARNMLLGMAAKKTPTWWQCARTVWKTRRSTRSKLTSKKSFGAGLSLSDVNKTLSTAWGSSYVNDFIDKGRVKKVYVQSDAPFRMLPQDVDKWYVRNAKGQMVPFSAFSTAHWIYGSPKLERYNGISSVEILGAPAPGKSTGDAMTEVENMIAKLPPGIGYEWTGLSYEEKKPPARKRRCCTRFRWQWCSCVWPRCMKAGRFRSR